MYLHQKYKNALGQNFKLEDSLRLALSYTFQNSLLQPSNLHFKLHNSLYLFVSDGAWKCTTILGLKSKCAFQCSWNSSVGYSAVHNRVQPNSQQGLDPYKSQAKLLGPYNISARQLAIFCLVLAGTQSLWLIYFAFYTQTFLEYSDTGAKFVFGDKYTDHFFAFKVRWLYMLYVADKQ